MDARQQAPAFRAELLRELLLFGGCCLAGLWRCILGCCERLGQHIQMRWFMPMGQHVQPRRARGVGTPSGP